MHSLTWFKTTNVEENFESLNKVRERGREKWSNWKFAVGLSKRYFFVAKRYFYEDLNEIWGKWNERKVKQELKSL